MFKNTFTPFLSWPDIRNRQNQRLDLEVGFGSAVLALPQAIALATLAGMPPEYGIYTSIIPVMIALIWGSSWHLLSGPNTAVCVLIAATVAPLAAIGSELFISYVFLLSLIVGVMQFLIGSLRMGEILDFISNTVVIGITQAVALIIIITSMSDMMGLVFTSSTSLPEKLLQIITNIGDLNPYLMAVGLFTLALGIAGRFWWKRYALVVAVVLGSICGYIVNSQSGGAETTGMIFLGSLSFSLLPVSSPEFLFNDLSVVKQLAGSALAIAFLGLMQTVVISRSIAARSGQNIDMTREITGQGISNMLAPFFSGFAGAGSFNRSAANFDSGARTPMAGIYSALFLGLVAFAGNDLISHLPLVAISAVLILVGYSLIDWKGIRHCVRSNEELPIFLSTFLISLTLGLNEGVFAGLIISLAIYLWRTSRPNFKLTEYIARNGYLVNKVNIDGNLFFGSVPGVERLLPMPVDKEDEQQLLLINTDHITYLDNSGAKLLLDTIELWQKHGQSCYLYVTRDRVLDILHKQGVKLEPEYPDWLIHQDKDHPMKHILYPYNNVLSSSGNDAKCFLNGDADQTKLAIALRNTALFGPVPIKSLAELLSKSPNQHAQQGDILVTKDRPLKDHLVLLDGDMEVQHVWSGKSSGFDRSHTWVMTPDKNNMRSAVLTAASRELRLRALTSVTFKYISADMIDELVGWSQQLTSLEQINPDIAEKIQLFRQISIFHHLPLENLQQAINKLQEVEFDAGEVVIKEGDKGDSYFLIEKGECEVIRSDPFSGESNVVCSLGAGSGFGEESLLQGGFRNATIRMKSPGLLLKLEKNDFDQLIQPNMVDEIRADEAHRLIETGKVQLLDCRYDMEYEDSRIPGAQLIPLHELRLKVSELNPDTDYIVYCRSGRRSKAAAFLLHERNFSVKSLAGGIKDWSYEIDSEPVDSLG